MILRRLTEHLKQQHWTAIGIELVIVVLGVFLGMQVSNWNEERVHRAEETAFLMQLREEIDSITEAVEGQTRYVGEVVAGGRRALDYLKSGNDCTTDCEELLVDFFHASQVWGSAYEFTKYREALRLGFPSNLATRRSVTEFYQFVDGWQAVNQTPPAYRERIRGHLTPEAAEALWKGCFQMRTGQIEELTRGCLGILKSLDAASILRETRADTTLIPELQYWLGQNIFALAFYPDMQKSAQVAKSAITVDIKEAE